MLSPLERCPRPAACRRVPWLLLLLVASALPLQAQTIDDGLMVPGKALFTGVLYGHDTWSEYWEGTLKRDNANIGTLTTQSVTLMANYGLLTRLNVIVMLPYVSTAVSGGTLHPQDGLQDLTLAVKGRLFETASARAAARCGHLPSPPTACP